MRSPIIITIVATTVIITLLSLSGNLPASNKLGT
jgi:hypothetical protein